MTSEQRAREFLFEWLGVDHRNDCRGSSIDPETGACDACKRRVQPPAKMVATLAHVFGVVRTDTLREVYIALYEQSPHNADEAIDIVQKLGL